MIDTVLFDLDGTLLPLDMDAFMKTYLGLLAEKCAPYGYAPGPLVDAVWSGTAKMAENDGSAPNEQRFWAEFARILGPRVLELQPELELFYSEEFHKAKAETGENPKAQPLLTALKQRGVTLVLATNPLFPLRAMNSRLSWIGVDPASFDHITSYETSHFCKPNPRYFSEILETIGKPPENCLMVGNDVAEDGAARQAGLDLYLVTDHLINKNAEDISGIRQGNFGDCADYLLGLL